MLVRTHPRVNRDLLGTCLPPAVPGTSFTPLNVPEIVAGYWWDAELGVSNLGASNFNWAEQNGKTAGDQVQTTLSRQPVRIAAGAFSPLRFDKATTLGGTGTLIATAAALQAGWTGATYVCGRWRVTGPAQVLTNRLFVHSLSAGNQRRFNVVNVSDTAIRITTSVDGTAQSTVDFPIHPFDTFFFAEFLFNPAAASGSRAEMWLNRVQQTASSGGVTSASLFDASARIGVTSDNAVSEHGYVTDCMWCAYANGIPSDADRDKLAKYKLAT